MGKKELIAAVRSHRDELFTELDKARRRIGDLEASLLKEQDAVRTLMALVKYLGQ